MNSSDIECPQCGATVYYELDRCPECGFDFCPADDDSETAPEPSRVKEWGISLAIIIVGWLVSFSIFILVANFSSFHNATDWQAQSLLLVAGTAFMGGYFASVIARRRPILHGVAVGVLSAPNVILLEMLWRDITKGPLLRPTTLLAWGLTIMGGLVGAAAYTTLRKRWDARPQQQADDEDDLYDELLTRVRHDKGVADRLIAFEHEQAPAASEIELIRNAIARWERDNR